jgi:hypothetical protein
VKRLEFLMENWFVGSMVVEEVGVDDGELIESIVGMEVGVVNVELVGSMIDSEEIGVVDG